jgi:hypothetical protein
MFIYLNKAQQHITSKNTSTHHILKQSTAVNVIKVQKREGRQLHR